MTLRGFVPVIAFAVLAASCKSEEKPILPREPTPLNKLSSIGNEVYPLATGAAYLVNQFDEQLFYLAEGKAVRVDGVDLRGIDPVIYPLSNGAAYLSSSDLESLRIYYLVGSTALPVQEGSITSRGLGIQPPSRENFLWAQAQSAISRSRRASDAQEKTPEEPERDHQ